MPEVPERRVPGHEPATDLSPDHVHMGHADAVFWNQPTMTQAERARWRLELEEREARRIPPGFAPPTEE